MQVEGNDSRRRTCLGISVDGQSQVLGAAGSASLDYSPLAR